MGSVARELLGEPTEDNKARRELRFGTHGSLSISLENGCWFDHEQGRGGGVLALVQERRGLDKAGALAWLKERGHMPDASPEKTVKPRQVAAYDYTTADGDLLFQVVRYEPKDFRQRRPDGNGGWVWSTRGLHLVLYRLPAVLDAVAAGRTIYVVESERSADALMQIGLCATCSPGGAGKWRALFNLFLAGADVVVLSDNDPQATGADGTLRWHPDGRPVLPGQDHAADVARALSGVAARVRVLMLPDLPPKGDVVDWLAAGGTVEQLEALTADVAESPAKPSCKSTANSQTEASAGRPVIRIVAGELHTNATQAESAIIEAGLSIYQRGMTLVRPIMQKVPAARGRMTVSAALVEMTQASFVDALCGCAIWEKYDGRSRDWLRANPPSQVADIIMSRVGAWRLRQVVGVITTPTIRPDGSILSEPGYDLATRLFHVADPDLKLTASVHSPTRDTAEKALAYLQDLLAEFPLVNDVSKAVALSGVITPVTRGGMAVVPLHLFRANTAGSGKSYLVDVASAIATGRPCPVAAAGRDEAETEKRLGGLLLSGFPLISLDNVNGEIGSDLLCQAIERPLVRVRRLGGSDMIEIESRATIYATGNSARVRGDMTRRTLIADLDANTERPELREFEGNPVAAVTANRGAYVSACLIIVRAYILAGCPGKLPLLASFEDWSCLVRSALVWLGCADPATSMEAARDDDPELGELREMVVTWRDALVVDEAITVRDLVDAAELHATDENGRPTADYSRPDLREALHKIAGERGVINTKRLGKWLADRAGRIVVGHRISKAVGSASGGLVRWKISRVN
jgi:putative DNA primase/helicase